MQVHPLVVMNCADHCNRAKYIEPKYDMNIIYTNTELANHVVNDYVESYRNGSVYTSYSVTAAVVDTAKLPNVWNELDIFSSELEHILPVYQEEIREAREVFEEELNKISLRAEQNPKAVSNIFFEFIIY